MPSRNQLHLGVLTLLAAGWTVALLVPIPGRAVDLLGGADNAFYFGKLLHVGVYAFLTLLTGAYRWGRPTRVALLVALIAHGWLTEYFQQFVQRGASVRDAVIDNVGVLVGVALGWRWYWHELRGPKIGRGQPTGELS